MELFQGGKCLENIYTHSAFKIRTDKAYVSPGLINCVAISSAFILLQSILFVGYSAVCLDGDIFEPYLTLFSWDIPASPHPAEPISAPCQWTDTSLQTSLEQSTRVHVKRSFRKRSKEIYEGSQDPSLEWSYELGSIVIGKRGPGLKQLHNTRKTQRVAFFFSVIITIWFKVE